jgi:uncharacterized protein (TIGR03118 family)
MKAKEQKLYRMLLIVVASVSLGASAQFAHASDFTQVNLVSDIPGVALTTDPNLVNPWGVSFSPSSPFWVSDNGTGLSTLYNGDGAIQGLVVTVPAPSGTSAPTGQVFNGTPSNFGGSHFIFATEDGTISAWSGGTNAALEYTSPLGAVYKGLAIGIDGTSTNLYATDFHNGEIDVFNSSFAKISVPGGFTDPNLPAGYAPFNIENIGGKLYVTYAQQDAAKHDDVAGPGNGFVDVYDTQGNLLERLVSNGSLNSPWGMAVAPSTFGSFANDLLIGNFGDGTIGAFDPVTGQFLGDLDGPDGKPLVNLGLWDLTFGNGGNGGSANDLYFTAGIPGNGEVEDHGLFGRIAATPEPGTLALIGSGLLALIAYNRRRVTTA